jgi:hypothetical protein
MLTCRSVLSCSAVAIPAKLKLQLRCPRMSTTVSLDMLIAICGQADGALQTPDLCWSNAADKNSRTGLALLLDDLLICGGGGSDAASLALSAGLVLANTEMGLHTFANACCV